MSAHQRLISKLILVVWEFFPAVVDSCQNVLGTSIALLNILPYQCAHPERNYSDENLPAILTVGIDPLKLR